MVLRRFEEKRGTLLDLCVSSLRTGHANLLSKRLERWWVTFFEAGEEKTVGEKSA